MKRTFTPSNPSSIKKWVYSRSKGLVVFYRDGFSCKSSWKLRELLKADHTYGDGLPAVEIKETTK